MHDSSPLGPDAGPELGPDSGPISRESYAGPRRIGSKRSTQENWI